MKYTVGCILMTVWHFSMMCKYKQIGISKTQRCFYKKETNIIEQYKGLYSSCLPLCIDEILFDILWFPSTVVCKWVNICYITIVIIMVNFKKIGRIKVNPLWSEIKFRDPYKSGYWWIILCLKFTVGPILLRQGQSQIE